MKNNQDVAQKMEHEVREVLRTGGEDLVDAEVESFGIDESYVDAASDEVSILE